MLGRRRKKVFIRWLYDGLSQRHGAYNDKFSRLLFFFVLSFFRVCVYNSHRFFEKFIIGGGGAADLPLLLHQCYGIFVVILSRESRPDIEDFSYIVRGVMSLNHCRDD